MDDSTENICHVARETGEDWEVCVQVGDVTYEDGRTALLAAARRCY